MNGPSTAGEIARRTGLTSGAVTGLIDRLERLGLVERMADRPTAARCWCACARTGSRPSPRCSRRWRNRCRRLLAGYSHDELKTLLDFSERAGEFMLARVAELNDGK